MANDWLPSRLADQANVFENIGAKIGTYTPATLGLTAAQVTAIQKLCTQFDAAYTFTEQCRAAMLATVSWRDQIIKGTPKGAPAPPPPTFPVAPDPPTGEVIGVVAVFRDYRDIILAAPGYTEAIGEDLMIVGGGSGGGTNIPIDDATPQIKVQVAAGYEAIIAAAMHGMDALRIEWQANGSGTWSLVGFLTKTPGHVIITPPTPGEPVAGRIRARYIKDNNPVGNYSQEAAVTVSA